jgi:hypothetical protein
VLNYMMAVEQVAADPRRAGDPHQAGYGDLDTAVGRVSVGQPAERWVGGDRSASGRESGSDRGRHLVVTGLIVLLALLIAVPLLLAALRPTGPMSLPLPPGTVPGPSGTPPGAAGPSRSGQPGAVPVPTPTATPSSASPSPSPSASAGDASGRLSAGTRGPTGVVAPRVAPLNARYSTMGHTGVLGLSGYQGNVVVSNPGAVPVTGWRVTLSLPSGETVSSVSGANARQSGSTVTFTPANSGTVAARSSVSFTFQVSGLLGGSPTGCAIDGRPCS